MVMPIAGNAAGQGLIPDSSTQLIFLSPLRNEATGMNQARLIGAFFEFPDIREKNPGLVSMEKNTRRLIEKKKHYGKVLQQV